MIRSSITLSLLVLALVFSTAAQQATTSVPSPDHPNANSTRTAQIKIRGCINGGKRYTFMQASTEAMFELVGDNNSLNSARGKLVEITANELAPQGSDELPKLRVNELHVVAEKCPIQARAASRPRPPSANEAPPAAESPETAPYADPGTATQTPPNVNNPNISGDTGAPSPGTGNPPKPPQ